MIDVLVIGCGASGIVCAINAKRNNNRVVVLEKNSKPLKKLLMTGNGKCNYFNEIYSTKNYYSEDIDIVNKIISNQNINEAKKFFDDLGIIPTINNGYYYPFSKQAITIKNALINKALKMDIEIMYDREVIDVIKKEDTFIVKCNNEIFKAKKVVISMGSKAYPKTGSDGLGYEILKKLGHTIIEPMPALVQLTSDFKYLKEWNGVRSEVIIELFENDKFIMKEEGEIQLTNYGVSGICIFNLSNYLTRRIKDNKEVIKINFVPFIETLITPWMDNYSKKNKDKNITELLEGFLNYKLVNIILKVSNIDKSTFYNELSNEEKLRLCKNLRSFPINIIGTKSYDNSQICNGGVKLTEIDISTMESKLVKGLYITGELLDINGNCGGYNLTTCWISGIKAGRALGDKDD